MYKKYYQDQKKKLISDKIDNVISKYGGKEHLEIPQEIKIADDTTRYNEYTETGAVKPPILIIESKPIIRKAQCVRGHLCAWGSFYHKLFGWGYKCCYSFEYGSICKGEKQKLYNIKLIKKREEEEEEEKNKNNENTKDN